MLAFDQRPFAAHGTNLNSWGTLYVPSGCRGGGGREHAERVALLAAAGKAKAVSSKRVGALCLGVGGGYGKTSLLQLSF